MTKTAVNTATKSKNKRIKNGQYIVLRKVDEDKIKNFLIIKKNYKKGKRVKITDILLNTENIFNSMLLAANFIGYTQTDSFSNVIRKNKLLKKRYKVELLPKL